MEKSKIKVKMSDDERYKILKEKAINVVECNKEVLSKMNVDLDILKTRYRKEANRILKPLAKKLGVIKKGYKNYTADIEFNYSNNNLDESINKQGLIYGNDVFVSFAKMLTCFEDIIKNAELIEIHKDRYVNTPRENTNLKKIYVLISAFKDNEEIIPVKLEIKELQGIDNVLYVTITLQKINETEVFGQSVPLNGGENSPRSVVKVSLAQLFLKIKDNSIKKYIPKQFYYNDSYSIIKSITVEYAA